MSIWHVLISESVSVYGRYVVGLLSVWFRDCWSAVGYNSSSVLMIGFQSVWCRLCIGLKSGELIPNLTRDDPAMKPTAFTVSSATLSVADSWLIHCKFCGFCRFRVGLAGVTGVLVGCWTIWPWPLTSDLDLLHGHPFCPWWLLRAVTGYWAGGILTGFPLVWSVSQWAPGDGMYALRTVTT